MRIFNFIILIFSLIFFIKILSNDLKTTFILKNRMHKIVLIRKVSIIVIITSVLILSVILNLNKPNNNNLNIVIILFIPMIYCIYYIIRRIIFLYNRRSNKELHNENVGWKVMPYGGCRLNNFKDRKDLEKYRLYTLIRNAVNSKYDLDLIGNSYSHFYIIDRGLRLEIKLEALNENRYNILRNGYKKHKFRLNSWRMEERIYRLLKKELLNYTYMIDGNRIKFGDYTLIARVAHCDIKVDIKVPS